MLPERLLSYVVRAGDIVPGYLTARDEPWVRVVLDEIDALVGERIGTVEAAWDARILPRARSSGARPRAAAAVFHVVRRRHAASVRAAARPLEIRMAVFEAASGGAARGEAIARAAQQLGIAECDVVRGLFADRASERRLGAPEAPLSPREIVEAHNLALVQGFLLRAEEVSVEVR